MSDWMIDKQTSRGKEVKWRTLKITYCTDFIRVQTSFLFGVASFQRRLFVSRQDHLADCLHVTHKALEKVVQMSIIFNRCY